MRILIVEDENKLAVGLKKILVAQSLATDIALNGREGLEMALDDVYDLIILDVNLPEKNGFEVAKKIREEDISTPILMLTARDATSDKVEGLDAGADDYLIKPFQIEELLARIRALTRKKNNTKNSEFTFNDFYLNTKTRIVKRAGKVINLSAKEYAVLEYLTINKGIIISKEKLIDHCWDSELDPFSKTVDVYIGYIRNKLEKPFPSLKPLIATVKGMGYKIE